MGTYRLARQLASRGLLADAWAGLSEEGRAIVLVRRKEPWSRVSVGEQFAPWQRAWQSLRQAEGIVPLLEVGVSDGALCLIEEFFEGEPVRVALSGAAPPGKLPFSVIESTALVLQAARGLHALAQLSPPQVHGDVSTTTLLLGADGNARFEVIGLAAAHPADAALGPARSELLSLSPEEAEGTRSPTTDVFRLGLLWLELLTGKPAFGGANHAEVKARFERFPGVTPGHFPTLPHAVSTLLAMMLAKAPAARPAVNDLVTLLEQVALAVGMPEPRATLASAFQRLFPTRVPTRSQLEGGTVVTVTPIHLPTSSPTGLTEGAVKLARINTKRVSADDVAAARAQDDADAARAVAKDWTNKHARAADNPKDFALGGTLLELQKLKVEQADAALRHAQSLGATLFDSLLALDMLDEDEVLPIAAGLLKQACLTGPQLLELNVGPAQAAMLPRDAADDWQVFPLKLEAGGLTVATLEPARLDVLDALKQRAKVRSVSGVRATQRTIAEGFARIYDGKTTPPDWARPTSLSPWGEGRGEGKPASPQRPHDAPPPSPLAPAPPQSFELDVPDFGAPGLALSASGTLEAAGQPSAFGGQAQPPEVSAEQFAQPYGATPFAPQFAPPPSGPRQVAPAFAPPPSGPQLARAPFAPPPSGPQLAPSPLAPPPGPPLEAPDPLASLGKAPRPPPDPLVPKPPPPEPPAIAPKAPVELSGVLDVTSRLLDALLSVMGDRGLEASAMISLVRQVAKQAGATGAPLDQVRLSVTALVVAALLEGKRAFEVPSRPATAACLGPHWKDFEDFVRPLLDKTMPSDPRGVVISLCFEVANTVGAVPKNLADATATLDGLRSRYPLAALAALEIVLASQ